MALSMSSPELSKIRRPGYMPALLPAFTQHAAVQSPAPRERLAGNSTDSVMPDENSNPRWLGVGPVTQPFAEDDVNPVSAPSRWAARSRQRLPPPDQPPI